jgi:hypothetical protein
VKDRHRKKGEPREPAAADIVACPKPFQTGVSGLKLWVRSTNFLLAMI